MDPKNGFEMEYNPERCAQHGDQLHDLDKLIYGSNGNDGLRLEVQRLKDWRELMDKKEERREKKSDIIITGLIINSIILILTQLLPVLIKAVK